MAPDTPLISVIVASYGHEAYIGQTLESIQTQSFASFEAIVVDDGSPDGSWSIIQDFAARDSRFRAFQHPDGRNHGLCATLALGLGYCRGEYVAFLESDDLWKPDCLEKRLAVLEKSGAGAVFNSVEILRMPDAKADGDIIMTNMRHDRFKNETGAVDISANLLVENVIPTFSSVMARKSTLENIDFISPVQQWIDWWMWIQISRVAPFVYIPEYFTIWRRHSANYNRSYSFFEYLDIWKNMRSGIKELFAARKYNMSKREHLILNCPAIFILLLRMFKVMKYGGIKNLYARIASKIVAKKQSKVATT